MKWLYVECGLGEGPKVSIVSPFAEKCFFFPDDDKNYIWPKPSDVCSLSVADGVAGGVFGHSALGV